MLRVGVMCSDVGDVGERKGQDTVYGLFVLPQQ